MVVGGGDSAIESALLLSDQNRVILSYRGESFSRIKPLNNSKIREAIINNNIDVKFNTQPVSIEKETVNMINIKVNETQTIKNDLVYIFAGGELPSQFLQKIGIQISEKFGEAILKH